MSKHVENCRDFTIKDGQLISGEVKSTHLIKEIEIYGFIPIKKLCTEYGQLIKNGPRYDDFSVYSNQIVSDGKSMPYYKKVAYNRELVEYNAKFVYSPELNYELIKKCLFRLNTKKCHPFFDYAEEADKYVREVIERNDVIFRTDVGELEQLKVPFHFGNNHEAFYVASPDSFVMFRSAFSDEICCSCFDFQVLCRYINDVTGNVSFVILDPSDIYV